MGGKSGKKRAQLARCKAGSTASCMGEAWFFSQSIPPFFGKNKIFPSEDFLEALLPNQLAWMLRIRGVL
jgi:hypothetical protein